MFPPGGESTQTNEGVEVDMEEMGMAAPGSFQLPTEEGPVKRVVRNISHIGNITVKDHFSLSNPSSTATFANDETLIFNDNLEQVVLEKKEGEDHITAKQATVASPGLMFTRVAYTIVAFLISGYMFVFCIQLVLFLFLGLAIESGKYFQR